MDVEEFAVDYLLVAILAGTFGSVSIEWFIDFVLTTAVRGTDYFADGATVTFQPHETLKGLSWYVDIFAFKIIFYGQQLNNYCTNNLENHCQKTLTFCYFQSNKR